jgi:hypothetical protein
MLFLGLRSSPPVPVDSSQQPPGNQRDGDADDSSEAEAPGGSEEPAAELKKKAFRKPRVRRSASSTAWVHAGHFMKSNGEKTLVRSSRCTHLV